MFSRNVEILLFSDFWPKKPFILNDLKKRTLPENVHIYGDMDKKRFFQKDIKKRNFHRSFDIFGYMYGQQTIFLSNLNKSRFFSKC